MICPRCGGSGRIKAYISDLERGKRQWNTKLKAMYKGSHRRSIGRC